MSDNTTTTTTSGPTIRWDSKYNLSSPADYHTWKIQIRGALNAIGARSILDPDAAKPEASSSDFEAYSRNNRLASSLIIAAVAPDYLYLIENDEDDAKAMWRKLAEFFEPDSRTGKMRAIAKFYSMRYQGEDIDAFLKEYRGAVAACTSLGVSLDDFNISAHLLFSLPPQFGNLRAAIMHSGKDELPKPEVLYNKIRDEAAAIAESDKAHALYARPTPTRPQPGRVSSAPPQRQGGQDDPPPLPCPACKGPHWMRLCTNKAALERYRAKKGRPATAGSGASANVAVGSQSPSDRAYAWLAAAGRPDPSAWYLDTGATHHLCGNEDALSNVRPLPKPITIHGIGGEKVATRCGTAVINLVDSSGTITTGHLEQVLLVDVGLNIVAATQLDERGFRVELSDGRMMIRTPAGDECGFAERDQTGLYRCRMAKPPSAAPLADAPAFVMAGTSRPLPIVTWHRRLGHASPAVLKSLAQRPEVTGVTLSGADLTPCHDCLACKSTRASFPPSPSRATAPLRLVHSDVCAVPTPSLLGSRYFVTFLDDYSRRAAVYPIKAKSDVHDTLLHFLAMAERRTGLQVASLRTDGGGEYFSNRTATYLASRGIRHEHSQPYTPEQNGRAKRLNRTLLDAARTMLHGAGLPPALWEEAILCATHVHNRVPHAPLPDALSPCELFGAGEATSLSHCRPFGCRAWVHVPKERRKGDKLLARAVPMIFVGYDANSRAWRVYDPVARVVSSSASIVFVEAEFPCASGIRDGDIDTLGDGIVGHAVFDPTAKPAPAPNAEGTVVTIDVDEPTPPASPPMASPHDADASPADGTLGDAATDEAAPPRRSSRPPRPNSNYPTDSWAMAAADDAASPVTADAYSVGDPNSYKRAISSPQAAEWTAAIERELTAHREAGTWAFAPRRGSKGRIIRSRWVFRSKATDGGVKYKARIVARGDLQDVSEADTYSPVAGLPSMRLLISLAAHYGWDLHQGDVDTAYLNAKSADVVYMEVPDGVSPPFPDAVCAVKMAMYGLRTSGLDWYNTFVAALEAIGFQRCIMDPCVMRLCRAGETCFIAIYVDDYLLVASSGGLLNKTKKAISSAFKVKDLGPAKHILGIKLDRDDSGIRLGQGRYVASIAREFLPAGMKGRQTPIDRGINLHPAGENEPAVRQPYLRLLGLLMYIMVGSRPDIAFAIGYLSRFSQKPAHRHWSALLGVLSYVVETADIRLFYATNSTPTLAAFSDSDYAGCLATSLSTSGGVFMLGRHPISWSSRRQARIARSTTEAEYLAICSAISTVIFYRELLGELGFKEDNPTIIHVDNVGALKLATNGKMSYRTRHVRVDEHFIREAIRDGNVSLQSIATTEMIADILTKPLARPALQAQRARILGGDA